MTKAELMKLVGENVHVYFKDGGGIFGILHYADEFSAKHNYRKVDYFYIGHTSFKVSHVRRIFTIRRTDKQIYIDEIRKDIMKLQTYKMFEGEETVYIERDDVLKIFDKYTTESEASDGDSD